jgi:hypothetical protein
MQSMVDQVILIVSVHLMRQVNVNVRNHLAVLMRRQSLSS